ncbi:transcription factor A, mitochondrial-like [Genypterus blacodes]|uniref:transcription factor A, mitochondrial-like n=1 Tax=Genypterus blacodes TaxID=154954 RepID=UPI003F75C3CB
MAPLSFMTAGVSLAVKSFNVFSCISSLARCTRVLPTVYLTSVKCLTSQAIDRPKKPMNAFLRFAVPQAAIMSRQHPGNERGNLMRNIAEQWKTMSPEQKQPFQEATAQAMQQYKVDIKSYKAQLSPAQLQQQLLETKQKLAKKKVNSKKRELTKLGKPKYPRKPFNIYMSEHYDEARGTNIWEKMKSLQEDWKSLSSQLKQVYIQLAQDDAIRFKNEINAWEANMVEIGREDLLRPKSLSARKKAASKEKKEQIASEEKAKKTNKTTTAKSKAGAKAGTTATAQAKSKKAGKML